VQEEGKAKRRQAKKRGYLEKNGEGKGGHRRGVKDIPGVYAPPAPVRNFISVCGSLHHTASVL